MRSLCDWDRRRRQEAADGVSLTAHAVHGWQVVGGVTAARLMAAGKPLTRYERDRGIDVTPAGMAALDRHRVGRVLADGAYRTGAQWSPERLINLAHILEEPHMDPRVDGFANRAADALRAFARVVEASPDAVGLRELSERDDDATVCVTPAGLAALDRMPFADRLRATLQARSTPWEV